MGAKTTVEIEAKIKTLDEVVQSQVQKLKELDEEIATKIRTCGLTQAQWERSPELNPGFHATLVRKQKVAQRIGADAGLARDILRWAVGEPPETLDAIGSVGYWLGDVE